MRVLMSLGIFYPSQVGGPGNTLYWIGKELAKKDVKVTAVVSDIGVAQDFASRDQWFDLEGIKVKYCNVKQPNSSPKLTWLTTKELKRNDVVMLSSLFYKPNFFVGLAALLYGKKIIWSPRGELLVPRGTIKKSYLRVIRAIFGKKVLFHATSEEENESIHKFLGENAKSVVIPNYMELPEKIISPSHEDYLLYVGRIMPIKALDNLIEGVSMSQKFMDSDYKLYLAGRNEGDYYEKLVSLIAQKGLHNKIIFKGMVEGEEKQALYAGAKATLLVSLSENFGNVIIESLAQGTPAITSLGTPWQVLKDNGIGYWIDNSPASIAATVDDLLSLPDDSYVQMREQCYEFCNNEFDIVKNIDKWVQTIHNL